MNIDMYFSVYRYFCIKKKQICACKVCCGCVKPHRDCCKGNLNKVQCVLDKQ